MRFHFGAIPKKPDFNPQESGWKRLKEPSPVLFVLIAILIAHIIIFLLLYTWHLIGPFDEEDLRFVPFLILIASVILIHEFIHALFLPGYGLSSSTTMGVWPLRGICYVYHESPLGRNRLLAIVICPFLVLSIFPIGFCSIFSIGAYWLRIISIFNGMVSCVDVLNFILIILQVPSGAILVNHGWQGWWKQKDLPSA